MYNHVLFGIVDNHLELLATCGLNIPSRSFIKADVWRVTRAKTFCFSFLKVKTSQVADEEVVMFRF